MTPVGGQARHASSSERVRRLAAVATARGLTIATAESCTGGLLAKMITDLPGVSACYGGGVVA